MNVKNTAVTSACIGMAVGAAAYMLSGSSSNAKKWNNKTRRLRKNTGKALRQAGDFINSVSYMVK